MSDTSYNTYTLIDTSTLTASFADNLDARRSFGKTQCNYEIYYIPKTGQSDRTCTVFVEYSSANVDWVPQTVIIPTNVTGTEPAVKHYITIAGATGGTTYPIKLEVKNLGPYIRISAKEDGSANFGTVKVIGTFF